MSDNSYVKTLMQLLPPGAAWAKSITSNFHRLLQGLSFEPQRVDDTVVKLFNESNLLTTTDPETLSHWETLLGITTIAATIPGRRSAIQTKLLGYEDPHKQFNLSNYQAIAAGFGYTFTITRYKPFYMGVGAMGDPVGDTDKNSILTFTMSTHTPDPAFEAAIRTVLANHIELHFVYP